MKITSIIVVLAPMIGSLIAGLFGKQVGRRGAHWVTIIGMTISFIGSLCIFKWLVFDNAGPFNETIYTWGISGSFKFDIGFLIDKFTAVMLVTVNFVSLMVHIYSVGYMIDDPGYQRFFSYVSAFTFFMLMLVLANNFLQLYFGWEGVGLVSYLLIGFWFKKETANFGSLKAFIVNRVGDLGFILGIAAIITYTGTLDYETVFNKIPSLVQTTIQIIPGVHWSIITVICILLFVGAMGKSAQMPLHVWLPESMEGPTPISALIHAATMVTAGVYMVARLSPVYEYSGTALSLILMIGATGALFTGIVGVVQNDIKRVVAYSTLSQLGYMMAALGASAFSAGIFHLITHAAFKALLFLAAGSVIIAMHHEQDMRNMGGLRRYMPITYACFLVGALALSAIPPFAGFYSKESIISAVQVSHIPGASYAYVCLVLGAFVTALYIFRALFLTFHGDARMSDEVREHVHETRWMVWLPMIFLAIPSVILGFIAIGPMLYDNAGLLGSSIVVQPEHDVMARIAPEFHGAVNMIFHAPLSAPFWFAVAGVFAAWWCYVYKPALPGIISDRFKILYQIIVNKYGFDDFNQIFFVKGTRQLANGLFTVSDVKIIDDFAVNGSARGINWISAVMRRAQTGYLYHYALVMVMAMMVFLWWLLS